MAIVSFDPEDLKGALQKGKDLATELMSAGVEIDGMSQGEIRLSINPNRPDLLDLNGVTRLLENFTRKKNPRDNFYKMDGKPYMEVLVEPSVEKVRPYFSGMVVKGADLSGNRLKYLINFTEKLADTYGRKRRKLAIGLHSLDAINGGLVYAAAAEGSITPLGQSRSAAFADLMKHHIKGVAYQDAVPNYGSSKVVYPYLRDSAKVIALIPITNCNQTRVTENTKELFIDMTGTSANVVSAAAGVIASSFIYSGAGVFPINLKQNGRSSVVPKIGYKDVKVSVREADINIGVDTGRHNIISLANKMGYTAAKLGSSVLFHVPPYRVDVLNDQDIIEDIAIAYGYDRIRPIPVLGTASGMPSYESGLENKAAMLAIGLGYTEAINSTLTSEEVNFIKMGHAVPKGHYISIADSKTSSITMMRTSLIPGIMQSLASSAGAPMPQKLFEIGKVFTVNGQSPKEETHIALASTHSKANFSEMKATMDVLLNRTFQKYVLAEHKDPFFIEGRCARLTVGGKQAALFGEVHPEALLNFGVEEPVVAAEMLLY